MTLVVGLTGGIGSGKSTVARMFAELGTPVVDTDAIGRKLVQPRTAALAEVASQLGADLVSADGSLDRKRLRELVFADPAKRAQLERILHPLIRARVAEELRALSTPYCILVVPLLVERGWLDMVDRILVVDVPESVQLARTMERDGLTAAEVGAIMRVQSSREARLARATDIISNDRDVAFLTEQVKRLHEKYQRSGSAQRN